MRSFGGGRRALQVKRSRRSPPPVHPYTQLEPCQQSHSTHSAREQVLSTPGMSSVGDLR